MPTALSVADGWQPELRSRPLRLSGTSRLALAALAVAGTAAAAVAAAITLSGSYGDSAALQATARASMVGVPIAVGLYAMRHAASARFGRLLVLAGFGWFITTFAESSTPWMYSTGRVAGWFVEVSLIYLILAFPSGRIAARVDRVLVVAAAALVACAYLPTALLVEQYPLPSQWGDCGDACPPNVFMVVAHEPAVIEAVLLPLRDLLTIALFVAVTARVAWRFQHATAVAKRALGPVLSVSFFRLAVFFIALAVRRIAPESAAADALTWLLALAVPLLALAFLVGVWRWRLFIAEAMQRVAIRLQGRHRPDQIEAVLSEEFQDRSLTIVRRVDRDPGHWVDTAGDARPAPVATSRLALTDVFDGSERVAAILHDPALSDDAAFNATAASYVLTALDQQRLAAETVRLAREVREERARVESAAATERRRIEHDLHDGAQQRLVALGIRLGLAAERAAELDPDSAVLLRALGTEVDQAREEVSSLARDGRPALLTERGLVDALRAAGRSSNLPVTVLGTGVERYAREIESAAYFCCLEAMQNAAKHARNATVVVVELSDEDDLLRVEARDDGDGFDERSVTAGAGLASMRERIGAVSGVVTIDSRPGRGTRVCARIPLR